MVEKLYLIRHCDVLWETGVTDIGKNQINNLVKILQPKLHNKSIYLLYQDNKKIIAVRDELINNLEMPFILENSTGVDWMYDGFLGYVSNFDSMENLIKLRQENIIIGLGHEPFIEGCACYLSKNYIPRQDKVPQEFWVDKGQCIEIDIKSKGFEVFPKSG